MQRILEKSRRKVKAISTSRTRRSTITAAGEALCKRVAPALTSFVTKYNVLNMQSAARVSGPPPGKALRRYYETLYQSFGAQRWWPARTRLEVILGAILTQNTAWQNAAMALKKLRRAGYLNLRRLRTLSRLDLESYIRPAGFYRQKAATICDFLDWLQRHHRGSLRTALAHPSEDLRRELLSIKGLGPETADAILLYAGRQPFFVADSYTRRVLERHALIAPRASYARAQEFLHRHLPPEHALFNEFHALLVEVGKRNCRREAPQCENCPLREFLPPQMRSRMTEAASLARGFNAESAQSESRRTSV